MSPGEGNHKGRPYEGPIVVVDWPGIGLARTDNRTDQGAQEC